MGLFVLLVAGTLVVRSRSMRIDSVGAAPSDADLRIKEVQLEEQSEGVLWKLHADQALVFEKDGKTTLLKVAVDVRDQDREQTWTIQGEEGDLYEASRNFEIRRNVVLTSSDGVRLETTVLRWHGAEKRLWTDAPVTIYKGGAVIHGSALSVLLGQEQTEVAGRVRATFARSRS